MSAREGALSADVGAATALAPEQALSRAAEFGLEAVLAAEGSHYQMLRVAGSKTPTLAQRVVMAKHVRQLAQATGGRYVATRTVSAPAQIKPQLENIEMKKKSGAPAGAGVAAPEGAKPIDAKEIEAAHAANLKDVAEAAKKKEAEEAERRKRDEAAAAAKAKARKKLKKSDVTPKPEHSAKSAKKAAKAAAAPARKAGGGIGGMVCDLLVKKKSNEEILAAVKKQFPKAKTSAASIAWYRSKLREEGKLPKA